MTVNIREFCPTCEPNVDPVKEIASVKWCYRHDPNPVVDYTFPKVEPTAGGASNKLWCDLVHRSKKT